jgi:hypothetical protein
MQRVFSPCSLAAGLFLLAGTAQAQIDFYSEIDGPQEPTNSLATGTATITVDTNANTLTYSITLVGLNNETAAHIHGPANPGQGGGIAHGLPAGNPKNGVWFYLQAEEADILAGRYYINIHTTAFPNGEIRGQICPTPQSYCACTTASGPPCGNADPNAGCVNSTGAGAKLGFSGLPSVILDTLQISATSVPANQFGILFMANNQSQIPFGDGQLCATGAIKRFRLQSSGGAGVLSIGPGFVATTSVVAGQTKRFQAWFRDPMGPCGNGFNTSDGLSVEFTP